MKIISLIEALNDFGGTPRKLLYFADENKNTDNEIVNVVYLPSSLEAQFKSSGSTLIVMQNKGLLSLIFQFMKVVRRHKPDVIHTHFSKPLLVGAIVSSLTRVPFIHHEHSSAHYRTGMARIFSRLALRLAKRVVCNSRYTANTITQEFHVPEKKLRVVHNPVVARRRLKNTDDIAAELGFAGGEKIILHVGGMIPERDQSTLIKAFALLKKEDASLTMVLVGDGPVRSELEMLAIERGVESSIRFVGYRDDIGDLLAMTHVFVNPTLDEGFGIAVVEAMLGQVPVIASKAGAHPEIIEANTYGYLYQPNDAMDLVKTLKQVLSEYAYAKKKAEFAARHASEKFAPVNYYHGVLKASQEALDTP